MMSLPCKHEAWVQILNTQAWRWTSEIPALMWRQETQDFQQTGRFQVQWESTISESLGREWLDKTASVDLWAPYMDTYAHVHTRTQYEQKKNNNIKSILRTKPQNYFERFLVLHQHSTLEALTWGSQASGFPASLPLHLIDKWHAN